jgi:hypothetical protein
MGQKGELHQIPTTPNSILHIDTYEQSRFCGLCDNGFMHGGTRILGFILLILFPGKLFAETEENAAIQFRNGLKNIVQFAQSRPDLFRPTKTKTRMLRLEEKQLIRSAWSSFYDYLLASGSLNLFHTKLASPQNFKQQQQFLTSYAAFLAEYRFALQFIELVENDPGLNTILNEPIPELGLPSGSYDRLKFHILNVTHAGEFSAFTAIFKALQFKQGSALLAAVDEDSKFIWNTGKIKGELLTIKNAFHILNQQGSQTFFPVQSGAAEWMGDTKVRRTTQSLITKNQIAAITKQLEPGDILFVRREWYLSNIGLPGFWPHTALYIGTPEKRKIYFADPEASRWIKDQGHSDLESLLQSKYFEAYRNSMKLDHDHVPQVLEAISEGVSFTSMEHSADADSIAVLRPKLSKRDKAIAIFRAFQYAGRPYDFNFDFLTDSSLVCTELIYKSYESAEGYRGLTFPVSDILGRKATPANEIVREFDQQFDAKQFDFILFLDGNEKLRKAVESNLVTFRGSWMRPKWHIFKPQ